MTKEEAIAWIKSIKDKYIHGGDDDFDEKRKKSLDMAVNALEQEDVLNKIKDEIQDNTYFINEITEKEGIDFETVEKIIDKYRAESEEDNAKNEVEVCSSNFIQLKQDVLNNKQLWRKLREIEDEDSD